MPCPTARPRAQWGWWGTPTWENRLQSTRWWRPKRCIEYIYYIYICVNVSVGLVGYPNVGKSSTVNAMVAAQKVHRIYTLYIYVYMCRWGTLTWESRLQSTRWWLRKRYVKLYEDRYVCVCVRIYIYIYIYIYI